MTSTTRRRHHRHPVRWALLVVVLVLAGLFLAPKTATALKDLHRLHGGHRIWFAAAVLAEVASLVAFSLVTYGLIKPENRPRFGRIFRLDLVTVALSHAVPVGSVAGSALGYELLAEEGVDAVESGFVKVSQSLLSGVLLQVLLAGSLFLQWAVSGTSTSALALAGAGSMLLVLVVGFSWLLAYHVERLNRIALRLLGWLPFVRAEAMHRVLHQLSGHLCDLLRTPGRLAWVSVWSLGNWVFDLVALWAAILIFGTPPSPVELTVAFCVAQVAAALPISPAGLGVVESALTPLLTSFGTSGPVAVLGVLAWRLVNFWLPLPVGGVAYLGILNDRRAARSALT